MLRAIIVDDEELARQVLCEQLRDAGGVEVVAECANGFEAVKSITELRPDLLFLDIQMPKLDGFEVLELIDDRTASVIFVTAYDQYALKAFDVHALDYLLKPFDDERFARALERAKSQMAAREINQLSERLLALLEERETERKGTAREPAYLTRLMIKASSRMMLQG